MRSICVIPARGGSKRIPHKNIVDFFGKPLISYAIQTAKKAEIFDEIIVSTDDEDIANISIKYGANVPNLRPKELSDDFTSSDEVEDFVVKEFIKQGQYFDISCQLYATAVLLKPQFLKLGYKALLNDKNLQYSLGVCEFPSTIFRSFELIDDKCKMFYPNHYLTRSQDLPKAYFDAGQFCFRRLNIPREINVFDKCTKAIILPRELVCDIDTMQDLEFAKKLYAISIKDKND
ncbi:CMP-pseudaminic acid synthetase [Campylobacter iguaniorum]|uniref:Pseudaminic acid cytidylyltransferase n=1 Tax=Campylobacter iguaniorum TaxID=1244531 RepID=A0A076FBL5_9BACT|nr:pseudaminic acid cytidylyltransferase [Campylobacter iguaniorum]AII15321.1 CMP-pseudaminic acid synthetase [Campylobacter iguaniorum]